MDRETGMETSDRFRVMLTLEVVPNLAAEFEQVWRDGAGIITGHPANRGHWLARSTATDHRYYIVSDWVDEESFRAFERSDAHLEHRARLHPYRRTGAFDTMRVFASAEPTR
jgi:heme-degrading monooxygenase HmoA